MSRRSEDEDLTGATTADDAEGAADTPAADSPEQVETTSSELEPAPDSAPEPPETGLEPQPETALEQQLRAEVDSLQEQLLRRRAEFENYRRRVERERASLTDEAVGVLLTELLPTIDNLERAATAAGDEQSVREGVGLILRTLQGLLGARGVSVEDPVGQPFDPEQHQALAHEPAPGHSDGTIVEVFQKGYLLGGRLLRPALVKVAKGDEAGDSDENQDPGETLH